MNRLLSTLLFAILCNYASAQLSVSKVPGTDTMGGGNLAAFGNKLVFVAGKPAIPTNSELWSFDGSNPASQVYDLNPSGTGAYTTGTYGAGVVVNNIYYFNGDDGTKGIEIYKWDGVSTPSLTTDMFVGTTGKGSSTPLDYAVLNNKIYCAAYNTTHDYELWEYNIASNTATRLTDIKPKFTTSHVRSTTAFKGKIYFVSEKPALSLVDTTSLYEYNPANGNYTIIYKPNRLVTPLYLKTFGSKLYFVANEGLGRELFAYDGTNAPQKLTSISTGGGAGISDKSDLMMFQGKIYFFSRTSATTFHKLMAYDTSTQAVTTVHDFGVANTQAIPLAVYNNKLYLHAYHQSPMPTVAYLFAYDGTNPPTIPDTTIQFPGYPAVVNNRLYLSGSYRVGTAYVNTIFGYSDTSAIVSIQNINLATSVTLYPNPTANITKLSFNLTQPQNLELIITDAMGRTVYTHPSAAYKAGDNKIEFDVRSLAAGIYHCRLATESNAPVWTGKLVKE